MGFKNALQTKTKNLRMFIFIYFESGTEKLAATFIKYSKRTVHFHIYCY